MTVGELRRMLEGAKDGATVEFYLYGLPDGQSLHLHGNRTYFWVVENAEGCFIFDLAINPGESCNCVPEHRVFAPERKGLTNKSFIDDKQDR